MLANLYGWTKMAEVSEAQGACGTACGAGKKEEPSSACGAAKPEEPSSACGAAKPEEPSSACGAAK